MGIVVIRGGVVIGSMFVALISSIWKRPSFLGIILIFVIIFVLIEFKK